jgi:DNA-binding NarL/FixJ family response regulator
VSLDAAGLRIFMEGVVSQNAPRIRVLVVDSSRIHTELLAEALQKDRRLDVISAHSSVEVLDTARRHGADVAAISDYLDDTPHRGLEVLRGLRSAQPNIRGVMLLDSVSRETVLEAFRAGARGIFSRCESIQALCKCVRCVYGGQIWARAEHMGYAVEALASTPTVRATDARGFNLLSVREMEVVRGLAVGLTNREIADQMGLSHHTIKNHVFRIFEKLGVSNRVELLFMTLSLAATPQQPPEPSSAREDGAKPSDPEVDSRDRFPLSYVYLAREYRDGRGVERDLVSSYMWYLICEESSLQLRDEIAREKGVLARLLDPNQIVTAQKRASEYLDKLSGIDSQPGANGAAHFVA